MDKPIGVFDSGIGGLTVVNELMRILPFERIIYFGDTARVPYGTKSADTVIKFSLENILFLLRNDVKIVVVACNTASSVALPTIKKHFKVPILGVIEPGAREAVYATIKKRIGVIGTRATITSHSYENEIRELDPTIKVIAKSCPLFVPLVEEGWLKESVTFQIAERYLTPLKNSRIDVLILGCTHYPLLKSVIRKVIGSGVALIDSAEQVAIDVNRILKEENLGTTKRQRPKHLFYVSDEPEMFARIGGKFLGRRLGEVRRVENV
jgi:glutamate racemase